MKKVICLLVASVLLLCGCTPSAQPKETTPLIQQDETSPNEHTDIKSFSYARDYATYIGDPGVQTSGFVNTERQKIDNAEQAVELAKKECTIAYGSIDVDFDADEKIYRVVFSIGSTVVEGHTVYTAGGCQSVYVDQNGVTKLIVYGE